MISEKTYCIKFLNIGRELERIHLFFQLHDFEGFLSIGMVDEDENTILENIEYDLSQFSTTGISIPLIANGCTNPVHTGRWYKINIKVTDRESISPIKIQTADSSFFLAHTSGQGHSFIPYIEFFAEEYFQWHTLILATIITVILVILIVFIHPIHIKTGWQEEMLSIWIACMGYACVEIATENLSRISLSAAFANIFILFLMVSVLRIVVINIKAIGYFILPFCVGIGALEYFVYLFRGMPIVPWDLYALTTALAVTNQYVFTYSSNLYYSSCICILAIFILSNLEINHVSEDTFTLIIQKKLRINSERGIKRIKNSLIALIGLVVMSNYIYPILSSSTWSIASTYDTQGFIASFVAYTKYIHIEKPAGYSKETAEAILEKYASEAEKINPTAKNIIFIMNEAYADLRFINDTLVPDDYMPFWDSLQENTIKGKVYVPVIGGGTCESEFEALTGLSTKYAGAYPYVSKIKNPLNSISYELMNCGFQTIGFHPFQIENWNRNQVYPLLGFREIYDEKDIESPKFVRWVIGDETSYDEIIRHYENKTSDQFFLFNVTMQNHGGYSGEYENFECSVDLSHQGDFPQAEQYFSLLKLSDRALEELIVYFSNVTEPTLICVFGDHQPAIEETYYEYLFGKPKTELVKEEALEQYATPFLIWANYDLQENYDEVLSVNYLRTQILQYAGVELNGLDVLLCYLYEKYPVLTKHGIIDNNGTFYDSIEDELLYEYQVVCYYMMTESYIDY